MLKFTAIVSLMLIVPATWSQADSRGHKREAAAPASFDSGSTLWAASLSCDSCGSECASACGTRHFRSCCFNYLRKKRGPDAGRFLSQNHYFKSDNFQRQKLPVVLMDDSPETWTNVMSTDFKFYPYEDTLENRLQAMYDV